LAGRE